MIRGGKLLIKNTILLNEVSVTKKFFVLTETLDCEKNQKSKNKHSFVSFAYR